MGNHKLSFDQLKITDRNFIYNLVCIQKKPVSSEYIVELVKIYKANKRKKREPIGIGTRPFTVARIGSILAELRLQHKVDFNRATYHSKTIKVWHMVGEDNNAMS